MGVRSQSGDLQNDRGGGLVEKVREFCAHLLSFFRNGARKALLKVGCRMQEAASLLD